MKTRELRNHTAALVTTLALLLTLGAFAACVTRDGGPQSTTGAGGGAVTAPASAGAQPAVPGTPDNPTGAVEQPPSGVTPGTATGEGSSTGGSDTMGQSAEAARIDCSTVRCAACPEGQTPALKPPNCCRCVPIDTSLTDCSAVRCAACPEGQHPRLKPPDCCRCVPN
jgi:hypothetical protein